MRASFDPNSEVGLVLHKCWSGLQDIHAIRAELRRCQDSTAVYFVPSFHSLCNQLRPHLSHEYDWQTRLANVLGMVSHIKHVESNVSFPRQMANNRGGNAVVSELRFRRLLEREREELYLPIIRILRMLNGTANLYDVSRSMFYWDDSVRKQWAYDYFGSND